MLKLLNSPLGFILSFSPFSQTRTTLSWIGNVALVCSSPPCFSYLCSFDVLIYFVFGPFSIHFLNLTSLHFVVLGGSIIACRSIQCHIVPLESDTDVFKSILFPIREPEQEHTFQHAAPQRGLVFFPPPRKMAKRSFNLLCAYVSYWILTCLHFYLLIL
jgi:hypothetical protein